MLEPFSEPMEVHAIDGEVVVLGPDGVGLSLTVAAAEESARRLLHAAQAARQQAEQPNGESLT